ncbi:AAA family ATPase [Maribacter luteus]|uniref:AAA family ATPase n=1 Tax=Maribacter luteus TaxID=2594478 RepID=A0A6I2MRL9_9FLAO|nr:ATP-binding protein [Maribacter luteus]MRX65492.1 AAA family ATPase [Maribacter luteus]
MSYKIAIASGKGGTGKTTVSVNLFKRLNERQGTKVQLVDCDVEEPNDIIFFCDAEVIDVQEVSQKVPEIDSEKCTFCRKCVEYCEFNAIVVLPTVSFAEINPTLCHSCGACSVACEDDAIIKYYKPIGAIHYYKTKENNGLAEGKLEIGSTMQTKLIRELKKKISDQNDIIIYDAPPGTSCPVVETIHDSDYLILVAEPTLFGLHDLKLMVALVREIGLEFGVVINKVGLGDNDIYEYLVNEHIELLGEIPFSKEYASLYAEGEITGEIPETIHQSYTEILDTLNLKMMHHEGNHHFKW